IHWPDRKRGIAVQSRWMLIRDEAGQPQSVLVIDTDIADQLRMEARLAQAKKLEAIGQLTGEVAHDFNNLLTVIQGNAEMLAEELNEPHPLHEVAQMVRMAADKGASLTSRLLAFARRQPLEPVLVNPFDLITDMQALLDGTVQAPVRLAL